MDPKLTALAEKFGKEEITRADIVGIYEAPSEEDVFFVDVILGMLALFEARRLEDGHPCRHPFTGKAPNPNGGTELHVCGACMDPQPKQIYPFWGLADWICNLLPYSVLQRLYVISASELVVIDCVDPGEVVRIPEATAAQFAKDVIDVVPEPSPADLGAEPGDPPGRSQFHEDG